MQGRRGRRLVVGVAAVAVALAGVPGAIAAAPAPTFTAYQAYSVGSWAQSVALGDLNGDGRTDIAMTTSFYFDEANDFKLFVFLQRADGTLRSPVKYPTTGAYGDSMGVATGDFNRDGKTDVAVATSSGVDFFHQAGGTLSGPNTLATAPARHLEPADMNRDGRMDLVVSTNEGVVLLKARRGSGFRLKPVTSQPQAEIEVGAVTGDAKPDVVGFTGHTIHVFKQGSSLTFSGPTDYEAVTGYWPNVEGIEVADVTGDGRADVVATVGGNQPGSRLNVFPQRSTGGLASPLVYSAYDIPEPVEAADMNADGRKDVVTLHGGWLRAGVFVQQDDGTLGAESLHPIPYATHYNVKGLALGDVSGDGTPDIVLADYNYGLVVLRQGVDTTPPETTITSETVSGATASFAFTSSEAGSTFACSLDGAPATACTSPKSYSDLAVGTHTFAVAATDPSGNSDPTPDTRSFTVSPPDTTPPETTITSTTIDGSSASFQFTSSEAKSTFACSIDGSTYSPCTSPKLYSGLTDGSHTFAVAATDASGNTDPTPATRTFTVGSSTSGADIAVGITDMTSFQSGSTVYYDVPTRNLGPQEATGVRVTIQLPIESQFVSATPDQGSCRSVPGTANVVSCELGTMNSGAFVGMNLVITITAATGSTVTTTVDATSDLTDPNPNNNRASDTTPVT